MKGLRRRDSSVISMLAIQLEDLSLIFNTHVESQVWIITRHWKERDMWVPWYTLHTGACTLVLKQAYEHWKWIKFRNGGSQSVNMKGIAPCSLYWLPKRFNCGGATVLPVWTVSWYSFTGRQVSSHCTLEPDSTSETFIGDSFIMQTNWKVQQRRVEFNELGFHGTELFGFLIRQWPEDFCFPFLWCPVVDCGSS